MFKRRDITPEPINEEEVITTMTVTLVPDGGGTEIVLSFQDLDGDGPDARIMNFGKFGCWRYLQWQH